MVIDCKWFNGNPHDLSCIKKCNYGLSLWKNIMNLNSAIFHCSKWIFGNGHNIRLWEDIWCGTEKLQDRLPLIFAIARNKLSTVTEAAGSDIPGSWNVPVIRNLQD